MKLIRSTVTQYVPLQKIRSKTGTPSLTTNDKGTVISLLLIRLTSPRTQHRQKLKETTNMKIDSPGQEMLERCSHLLVCSSL